MNQDMIARARARRTRSAVPLLAIGGVCGLAWAAGLRGFMAELAGSDSTVSWYGTFAQILLPGLIAGVLLGWAEHIRRTGGRRGWRLLATAPLAFTIAVFVSPDVFKAVANGQPLLSGGIGGGAIAVPLFGDGRRIRPVRARATVVPHSPRHGRPRSHPRLGNRLACCLRPGVCAHHAAWRMARALVLLLPGHTRPRLHHPPPPGPAGPTGCPAPPGYRQRSTTNLHQVTAAAPCEAHSMKDSKSGTHCRRPRLPSRAARAPASHRQHCRRAGTRTERPFLRHADDRRDRPPMRP